MAQSKKPTARTPSAAYLRMEPRWKKIDALLGGTETMREAGKEYTPQYENETNAAYERRLGRTVLHNLTEYTLETLVGKPFKEDIVLGEDMPTRIRAFLEDIDLQGNNLQTFARNWFRDSWAKGFSHVLIEHSTPEEKVDSKGNPVVRSLEDDKKENLRPYWVHIKPENIIAAYTEVVKGKEVLVHVRILEQNLVRNGWEETLQTRVRVLEPGRWWVYKPADDKESDWVVEDQGTFGLDFIPLVTFYAGKRAGLFECKPPLTDIADLNIAHWQSSSDQRNVLTVARFPILAASGVPPEQEITIGPNRFLTTEDAQGKWYYVEHTGAAIDAGAKDLDSLEEQIAIYGAEFLRKRSGTETATGRALDSAESNSYLGATVKDFKDAMEQALMFTAAWINEENGGSIVMNSDLGLTEAESAELDTLLKMRAQRDLSRKGLIDEMMRRRVLADDFDREENDELLEEEGAQTGGLGGMFGADGQGTGAGNPPQQPPVEDEE